jgi:opacity protein-like surface antigen
MFVASILVRGWLGGGPQLMAPSGRVRPYVNATAGFSYFATTSSVKGRSNDESFADDTNFDDTPFSWGGGAGILIPVSHKERSLVFIDIGARYHNSGKSVQYLREGGIQDLPDGAIQVNPIRSRADLVTWHVGLSIGGAVRGGEPPGILAPRRRGAPDCDVR